MSAARDNGKRISIWLGGLQIFIGIGAVPAGIMMIIDPSGPEFGTTAILANSPFTNFLIPGIFLLVVNGIITLIGGAVSFKRYRYAGEIAMGLGAFMIVWIFAEIWWLGSHWLMYLYLSLGIVEIMLGLNLRKTVHYSK